jgi:hypothetical protein
MKFNSKSVTLNRGVNTKVGITLPPAISTCEIPVNVWDSSVDKFNKDLDERSVVTEFLKGMKVDVLRVHRSMGTMTLWINAKEKDLDVLKKMHFTLSGKLVYANENTNEIEQVIIEDMTYATAETAPQSVFKKKKLTS